VPGLASTLSTKKTPDFQRFKRRLQFPESGTYIPALMTAAKTGLSVPNLPAEIHFPHRHLLGIQDLSPDEITYLLDLSDSYAEHNRARGGKLDVMRDKTLINLFFEDSTRTRTSFELAGMRLGADVINIAVANSSIKKGETIIDTAMTLNAMHADALAVRAGARDGRDDAVVVPNVTPPSLFRALRLPDLRRGGRHARGLVARRASRIFPSRFLFRSGPFVFVIEHGHEPLARALERPQRGISLGRRVLAAHRPRATGRSVRGKADASNSKVSTSDSSQSDASQIRAPPRRAPRARESAVLPRGLLP